MRHKSMYLAAMLVVVISLFIDATGAVNAAVPSGYESIVNVTLYRN